MGTLRIEKGDIVNGNYPVFCQQVNCKGVMGLAKAIRMKYPEVYEEYKKTKPVLGMVHYSRLHDGRVCINMYAQDGYGRDRQNTDYRYFQACLRGVNTFLDWYRPGYKSIALPYGIGCGLAGGDWGIIQKYIAEFAETIPEDVIIVKKE